RFHIGETRAEVFDHVWPKVGRDKIVLMLVSGEVDSAVGAALLHKALLQGDDLSLL
ncbi:putative GMP synthase, partial [Daphnia magna]